MYFEYIKNGASFEKAYDYAVNRKFDAAIYGVWFGCNYGGVATYYALHEILRSFGLNVIMIDKPMINKNDSEHGDTHSRRFVKEHYEISRMLKTENFQGNAVINYTEKELPYTRIIEHKHFENSSSNFTVI